MGALVVKEMMIQVQVPMEFRVAMAVQVEILEVPLGLVLVRAIMERALQEVLCMMVQMDKLVLMGNMGLEDLGLLLQAMEAKEAMGLAEAEEEAEVVVVFRQGRHVEIGQETQVLVEEEADLEPVRVVAEAAATIL